MGVLDVGCEVGGLDARHIGRNHRGERLPRSLAQRIEDRPVEQRRTVRGDQRVEAELGSARLLRSIGAGEQPEWRIEAAHLVVIDGDVE